jgi:hypothetical protein
VSAVQCACSLQGSIPADLQTLRLLSLLRLQGNNLSGTLPPGLFSNLGSLNRVSMVRPLCKQCSLSVRIGIAALPSQMTCLERTKENNNRAPMALQFAMRWLLMLAFYPCCRLQGNNLLTGPIPAATILTSTIVEVDFSNNMLTGPIPDVFSVLADPSIIVNLRLNYMSCCVKGVSCIYWYDVVFSAAWRSMSEHLPHHQTRATSCWEFHLLAAFAVLTSMCQRC